MGNTVQRKTEHECRKFQKHVPNKECCWDILKPGCGHKGHSSCIEHEGGKVVHTIYPPDPKKCSPFGQTQGKISTFNSQNNYLIWIVLILAVVICVYCYNKKK